MLVELRVKDFAIIDDVTLRLAPGLNVLTGETGAGKSLIVGALSLLLGERAQSDLVRARAPRAVVEGVFELDDASEQRAALEEQGIDAEDGLLILRREVAAEGRNRAWVNGSPATASLIGRLGRGLVDLHGQHEHQTLLRGEEQRAILDAHANAGDALDAVAGAFDALQRARARLSELDQRREAIEREAAALRSCATEIEDAAPQPGEDADLEAEGVRLQHAEELSQIASSLSDELYQSERSVSSRLAMARRPLERLAGIDARTAEWQEALESALQTVQELGRAIGDYAASVEHDPARLEQVRQRQDKIFRLLARYGETIEDVLETGAVARSRLDELDRAVLDRRALVAEIEACIGRHTAACEHLSEARARAAESLAREVCALLPSLGLAGRFEVALSTLPNAGRAGAESVEFRVTLNPDAPPGQLSRVASGGEISRLMLALKTVLARDDRVPTLVFDEIDAGIGGRTAHVVGDLLHTVGQSHQVFVVTHLAQIAARADHHLVVQKAGSTATTVAVRVLEGDERIRELARLLGGDPDSGISIEHARELLTAALSTRA